MNNEHSYVTLKDRQTHLLSPSIRSRICGRQAEIAAIWCIHFFLINWRNPPLWCVFSSGIRTDRISPDICLERSLWLEPLGVSFIKENFKRGTNLFCKYNSPAKTGLKLFGIWKFWTTNLPLGRGANNQNGNLGWFFPLKGGGVWSCTYLFWKMI